MGPHRPFDFSERNTNNRYTCDRGPNSQQTKLHQESEEVKGQQRSKIVVRTEKKKAQRCQSRLQGDLISIALTKPPDKAKKNQLQFPCLPNP
jgi:hypothetical protein